MDDERDARPPRWLATITWVAVGPVLTALLLWGAVLDIVDPNTWVFPARRSSPLGVALAALAVLPLLVRRRWPLASLAVAAASTVLLAGLGLAVYFPALAVTVLLATVVRRGTPRACLLGVAMTGIALWVATAQRPHEYLGTTIPAFVLMATVGLAARWFDRRPTPNPTDAVRPGTR